MEDNSIILFNHQTPVTCEGNLYQSVAMATLTHVTITVSTSLQTFLLTQNMWRLNSFPKGKRMQDYFRNLSKGGRAF